MNEERTPKRSSADAGSTPERQPYAAPCIEETGDFERLVLNCSHLPPGGKVTGCNSQTVNS